jgi:hypothetical protein
MSDPLDAAFDSSRDVNESKRAEAERAQRQLAQRADELGKVAATVIAEALSGYDSLPGAPLTDVKKLASGDVESRMVTVTAEGPRFTVSAAVRISWLPEAAPESHGRGLSEPVRFTVTNRSDLRKSVHFDVRIEEAVPLQGGYEVNRHTVQQRLIEALRKIG